MWEEARRAVSDIFFKDKIEVYRNEVVEDDIGEELDSLVSVGQFLCNIEDSSTMDSAVESGHSLRQSLRISTAKGIDFSKNYTYKIKVVSSRLNISATDVWFVQSIVEGQISTVINAQRETSV